MPFFSYPANADWLLPIISIPLGFISLVFKAVFAVGPFGQIAFVALVLALFSRNIMGPHRA